MNRERFKHFMPPVVGLLEFSLSAFMFLMAVSSFSSYLTLAYLPEFRGIVVTEQAYIGILALFAFVFGIAGAISAFKRWSLFVSIFGALLMTCWGIVTIGYALTWLAASPYIQLAVTWGTFSIFFSMLIVIIALVSRDEFAPHALSRAGY